VGVKVIGDVTGDVGGEAIKVVGGAGKAIKKGIGGLFGGGDDKDEEKEDK